MKKGDNVADEDDDDAVRTCVARNRIMLYCLPQSQNNCRKIFSLIRNSVTSGEVQLGGLRASWAHQCIVLTVPILPPPMVDHLICGDSYIYRMLRNNSSVHSVTVTLSCDTLVLTASSSATSSPFFLPWERVSWTFFGLSLCQFSNYRRTLGFLELFLNSPLSVFNYLPRGPASRLAITKTTWSK